MSTAVWIPLLVFLQVQDPDLRKPAFEQVSAFLREAVDLKRMELAAYTGPEHGRLLLARRLKELEEGRARLKIEALVLTERKVTGCVVADEPLGSKAKGTYGRWLMPGAERSENVLIGSVPGKVDWSRHVRHRVEAKLVSVAGNLEGLFGEILLLKSIARAAPPEECRTEDVFGVLLGTGKGDFEVGMPSQSRKGPYYTVVASDKDWADLAKLRYQWARLRVQTLESTHGVSVQVKLLVVDIELPEPTEAQRSWIDKNLARWQQFHGK